MIPKDVDEVSAGYAEGELRAAQDCKGKGAFNNPFEKGTYQYNGYAYAESKHFKDSLINQERSI